MDSSKVRILRADRRHLKGINNLIVKTRIGSPMKKLEGCFWIVKDGERTIGCMGAEFINTCTVILTHLAVDEMYRRQGIGMSLFNHALRFAESKGSSTAAFITMYYHFNRFKKRGFRTSPRRFLPEDVQSHWMFTAKRYMKCAAMIKSLPHTD